MIAIFTLTLEHRVLPEAHFFHRIVVLSVGRFVHDVMSRVACHHSSVVFEVEEATQRATREIHLITSVLIREWGMANGGVVA